MAGHTHTHTHEQDDAGFGLSLCFEGKMLNVADQENDFVLKRLDGTRTLEQKFPGFMLRSVSLHRNDVLGSNL